MLADGRVRVAGPPAEVRTTELVADVYDVQAVVTVVDEVPHVRFTGVIGR